MKGNGYRLAMIAILAAALGMIPDAARAANLTLGAPIVGGTDGTLTIPLQLDTAPGEEVAGLQCDILLKDTALEYEKAEIGPVGKAAAKILSANPLGRAKVRLILVGLNQNIIGEGVVANLVFRVPEGSSDSPEIAGLGDIIFSDPFGTPIPVTFAGAQAAQPIRLRQHISQGAPIPWMALPLFILLCGFILAITRVARKRRKPRPVRRLHVKKRRET